MRRQLANDSQIATLAGAQHGVVARWQLLALGLSGQAIDRRVRSERLHLLHRGVYAVGHRVLTVEGRWLAAVFAAGGEAVLSHASAAYAWELRPAGAGAIHVTVPGDPGRARRTGLRIHRSTTLAREETTSHRGIPITTPVRTIIDLATTLRGRPLEHALDLGEQRGLVDFAWRDARLIVEVDGYRYHRSPGAFEEDRARDVTLSVAGWTVLRFTWAQITRRPAWVAAAIQHRLAS